SSSVIADNRVPSRETLRTTNERSFSSGADTQTTSSPPRSNHRVESHGPGGVRLSSRISSLSSSRVSSSSSRSSGSSVSSSTHRLPLTSQDNPVKNPSSRTSS